MPEPWLEELELVLIRPGLAQRELQGDLVMASQLARHVFPALLCARSSPGIRAACQIRGPEPGGIFLLPSLGSLGAVGAYRLGGMNCCRRTPCPLWGTLAGQDMGLILFSWAWLCC